VVILLVYRYYQSGDEKEIVTLWNECLPKDPITSIRFRNLVLLDANFDPMGVKLAFQQDKLVGCVYVVRRILPMYGIDLENDNGWIPFFFIHPSFRNRGIAKKLLSQAIEFLAGEGRKNVFFASYAPNYILPGIDEDTYPEAYQFLQSQGFHRLYSPVAMDRNLVGYEVPLAVKELKSIRESEGYTFEKAEDKDLYDVIQFANLIFNPDWGRAIREGILQGLPIQRILVARQNEKLIGFCLYGGYEGVADRFGPFGVDPDQQGKGIGKIMLHECLRNMRSDGLHGAWFLWTSEKSAAGMLYKKTGFQVTRTFHVMKKSI